MKKYIFFCLILLLYWPCMAQKDRKPSASQMESVGAWLLSQGIADIDTPLQCHVQDSLKTPFRLGTFFIDKEHAVWSFRISSTLIAQESWTDHQFDPYDPDIASRRRSRKAPEYRKVYGETNLVVVEIPVVADILYKAVFIRDEGDYPVRDTVDVHPRIYYFINKDEPSFGYMTMTIPRRNNPKYIGCKNFLENFCGVILGIDFDGKRVEIRREIPGYKTSMSARIFQEGGRLPEALIQKYFDGPKDWNYVEVYRLLPDGTFGGRVVRLK